MKGSMQLRQMTREDIPQALQIESRYERPWSERDFRSALKLARGSVATFQGTIVGFIIYEYNGKQLRIHNMAVLRQREGIGRFLIENLPKAQLICRVNEINLNAQKFFAAMGLRAIKVERNYYSKGESAYLFVSGE